MLKEHGYVRCGAVVPKLKVANIEFNVNEIISNMQEAEEKNVQIVCFPELSITGYSCSDLFYQDILIEKAKEGLNQIIENCFINLFRNFLAFFSKELCRILHKLKNRTKSSTKIQFGALKEEVR